MRKAGKTIALSIGSWGGLYFYRGSIGWRLCCGWIAIDFLYYEMDVMMRSILRIAEEKERAA